MKIRTDLILTCLAASLLGCTPAAPQFTAQDEAAVRAQFDAALKDIQAGNWDAWANVFAEDGVLQPPNAPTVRGRAAILAWGHAFPPIESVTWPNVQVHGDGNLAWGTTDWTLTVKGMPPDHGKQLSVLRRSADGKWLVVAVGFSSDVPLPAPAPTSKRR